MARTGWGRSGAQEQEVELMGLYLNPGNEAFRQAVTDDIYIDKTKLIALINQRINRSRVKYICVSRPRRFGKSMAADMLAAYYGKGCDSRELFAGRKTEKEESFPTHLNRHNVIRLDIQRFLFDKSHLDIFIDKIQEAVIRELEANIFKEYSMLNPGPFAKYFGFTEEEVKSLN